MLIKKYNFFYFYGYNYINLAQPLKLIQKKKIYPKNKKVSFIASNKTMCKGHLYRQQMISKFENKVEGLKNIAQIWKRKRNCY